MSQALPAWIELRWPAPISIQSVRLTFDTGLHRHLTFTHSDSYLRKMHWGSGQPETVKDFNISIETEEGWDVVEEVRGNWKRTFSKKWGEPHTTSALR